MKSENLAIMFVDIKGFTTRTSIQSRMENHRMLARFEALVRPVTRAFGGSIVKSIGDAFLITFRSPTDAVHCGMGIQDLQYDWNHKVDSTARFEVRVVVNVGEVRVEKGDVFGEAVNIASRIESVSEAGEVYFSEAVYLVMNKKEVPWEDLGRRKLKGLPDSVGIFKVPKKRKSGNSALPFGGQTLGRIHSPLAPPSELQWGGMALWAALGMPQAEARAHFERRWKNSAATRWFAPLGYLWVFLLRFVVFLLSWQTWAHFLVMIYDGLKWVLSQFPPPQSRTGGLGKLLVELSGIHESARGEARAKWRQKGIRRYSAPFIYLWSLSRDGVGWLARRKTWILVLQSVKGFPRYLWRFACYSPGFVLFWVVLAAVFFYWQHSHKHLNHWFHIHFIRKFPDAE